MLTGKSVWNRVTPYDVRFSFSSRAEELKAISGENVFTAFYGAHSQTFGSMLII